MKYALLAALLVFLLAPGGSSAAEGEAGTSDRTKLGQFVPASEPVSARAISLADASGNTVQLSDFRGKLVILSLWATWCEPCLREMPSLERLQSRLGERIAILAVSEDRGGTKVVEPFITKLGLKSIETFLDPKSAVGHAFEVRGLPTSLLIDHEGRVLGRVEGGAEWDSTKMLSVIEPLLAGNALVKGSPG
jgi:thiol-disulfide isomerase/thioredoxin